MTIENKKYILYQSHRVCIWAQNNSTIKLHDIVVMETCHYFSFSNEQLSLCWAQVKPYNNINLMKRIQEFVLMCLSLSALIPSHICRKMFEKVFRQATDANHLSEIHDYMINWLNDLMTQSVPNLNVLISIFPLKFHSCLKIFSPLKLNWLHTLYWS